MAELNIFKTVTHSVQNSLTSVYTAPSNYTGIVLSTQVTNVSDSTHTLTFTYQDSASGVATEILSQFSIPGRDALGATSGKLVVTTGGILKMSSSGTDKLKAVVGILESLNG